MSPRNLARLDLINRILTPVLDLAFVAVLTTGMFLLIEWFYTVLVPAIERLFS